MAISGNALRARSLFEDGRAEYALITVRDQRAVLLRGEGFLGVAAALAPAPAIEPVAPAEFAVLLLPEVSLLRLRPTDPSVGEALFADVQVLHDALVLTVNVDWRDVCLTPEQWRTRFASDLAGEKDALPGQLELLDVPAALRDLPDRVTRRHLQRAKPAQLFQDVWLGTANVNFEVMASLEGPAAAPHQSLDVLAGQALAFVDREVLRSVAGIEPR